MDNTKPLKIAVGLSGGVDSSVAALLLKRAGHKVIALFMQNWHDTEGTLHGDCEWEEDRVVAQMVAKKLDIPFYFVDLSVIYKKRVVDYMFDEYSKGRTPNPDVLCNREIKFDAFLKHALELGADYVATGHYCKKDEFIDSEGNTIYRILAGDDKNKDQSYFLCQLTQDQLSKAIFPIGDITKPEVRRLASEAGLPSAEKKDSQGICFVGKVDLPVFLQQQLEPKDGDVVEIFKDSFDNVLEANDLLPDKSWGKAFFSTELNDTYTDLELKKLCAPLEYRSDFGKIIGKHIGVQFYTIGQRRGLNIGGHKESIFIISTDINTNTIYVGEGQSHPGLYRKGMFIPNSDTHWIRTDLRMSPGDNRDYLVRVRYRQPLEEARLFCRAEGIYIIFKRPQRGISPGQFAVWYSVDGDEEMIGSGIS